MERSLLIEIIQKHISNKKLKKFLLEQMQVRQVKLSQPQIDDLLNCDIHTLAEHEQKILGKYVDFFKAKKLDQTEVDDFVHSIEESIRTLAQPR